MKTLKFTLLCLMLALYSQLASAQLASGQDKFLGNIHTGGQTALNFDLYWNQVTPGNAGKWASCEQNRDDFNYWLWLDRAYDHAKQNDFVFKEHTLVWGASSGEPTWMSSVDEDEQMDEVIEWYEAVAERYPDIELIDVVNEPLHDPPSYTEALGGDGETGWDWVIWSFEEAREIFPNAKLLLNEYNVLNYTSTCESFLEIVEILQERDLIDGVGLQAHSLESIDIETIKANLDSVAATGLDIYISEYEARGDDETQLALFQEQFPVFWEHESVKGVTLWGYLEGDMWRETAYLLEDDGVTERPALEWLREYFDYDTDSESVEYTFETNVDGNGSIKLDPEGGVYNYDTVVTATAVADSGYEFSYWTGDVSGSTNPTTLTMVSNRTLTAHFVEEGYVEQYTLSVTSSDGGTVTQSPTGTTFDEGTTVTLTATADSGYKFDGWTGTTTSSSTTLEITMDGNYVLAASFSEKGGEGCDSEIAISMPYEEDGVGEYCYVASGEVSYINSWNMDYLEINGEDFSNTWASTIPESEDGKIHIYYYSTVSWSHFEIVGTDSDTTETDTAGTDTTITDTTVYYKLTTTINGEGSVSPSEGSYEEGTSVTLTATPDSGYIFSSWSGDTSSTSETITITMDADKSITANFADTSEIDDCSFDTPLATVLPSINSTYNYVHVLGDGPDLSNISNLTINWDLTNDALWQFSVNTTDGVPDWYKDLSSYTTQSFSSTAPMLSLSGSEFEGLDGDYYVTTDDDNFVMVETSGTFTIYCSNSSDAPDCISVKDAFANLSDNSDNSVQIYPNPVSDLLSIEMNDSEIIQNIKIYNSLGQIVESRTSLNAETYYSMSLEIPVGLYLLQIESNEAIYTKQFIKK